MKQLVEVIAKSLVENPDEVVVTETEKDDAIVVELKVGPADMGKVIGRQGRIAKAIRTDDAERFLDIEYVLLDTGKELRRLNIQNVKFFKNLAILKFEGIDNINDIEMYKGRELWIPREEAQELGEDEYYVADLIGMEVLLENGEKFGVLRDVMETGANDVYIVDRVDGEEILLPAIHDCVLDVDVEKNTMTVHLMKGLV